MGSAYIHESLPKDNPLGDDDKIYFFFSEVGREFDFFDNTVVSRIARVCKVRGLGFTRRSFGHGADCKREPDVNEEAVVSEPGGYNWTCL